VPKTTIYASSQRGMLHAIEGESGRTLWITSVGNSLYPTTAPAANDKYVALCNGSTIYVLRTSDGSVAWSKSAMGSPGAGPALTDEFIFIPMISGQVETYMLDEPKRPAGVYRSFGHTIVQPVVSSNSVAWPTDSGNIYVGYAHSPGLRFRLQTADSIESGPAFLAPDKVIVTSLDGYIYCLDEKKGNILWRFTTGEPISESPIARGDSVYAISKRGNMYAIDVSTSMERWVTSGFRSYLAGSENRLYCLDTRGDMAILDRASGSRMGTLGGIADDAPFVNTQTDRIFLVMSTGLMQCLHETTLPFPLVHYQLEPAAKAAAARKGQQPDAEEKMPAGDADPFGGPATKAAPGAAADPFAP
jgi:outer membrane protein assembly factor BamB